MAVRALELSFERSRPGLGLHLGYELSVLTDLFENGFAIIEVVRKGCVDLSKREMGQRGNDFVR